jgi:septal ring factor EnvC (AmiA/AmiB activator)
MTVDPYETEDTSDWLGCPTPLETCQHQLRMYENEFEELTLQLRQAREKIFKLVEMHAEAADERDALRSQLATTKAEVSRLRVENSELSGKVRSLMLVSDQRDHLFRENQKLLMEKRERRTQ